MNSFQTDTFHKKVKLKGYFLLGFLGADLWRVHLLNYGVPKCWLTADLYNTYYTIPIYIHNLNIGVSHKTSFSKILSFNKNPSMKNYSIIDKDINKYRSGKNKNEDIFLLGYIKACCTDYRTGKSHVSQEKLFELTRIPVRTIQSITSRLRKTELINVETKQIGLKRLNVYCFELNPSNFFYVNNSFYYTDVEKTEKGLLLLIKSLCINNSNTTLYKRTEIAKLIGQDRNTVSILINKLIEKNMLLEIDCGFVLPANYFPIYSKDKQSKFNYEKVSSFDEFALNSILDFCNSKHTVLFTPDLTPLKWIFAKYHLRETDIVGLENEIIESYYLPRVLEKRCEILPQKIESLNYFLTVLNIEYVERKKSEDTLVYL